MLSNKRKKRIASFNNVNLTPLLDFIVSVIPVLLLSVSFIEYVSLDASLPVFASTDEIRADQDKEDKLGLTVAITEQGFVIGGKAGLLKIESGSTTIKRKIDGEYDFLTLSSKMLEIKKDFPKEWTIIIVPESDTKFDTIISTMDAARESAVVDSLGRVQKTILFPNVVLGGGII